MRPFPEAPIQFGGPPRDQRARLRRVHRLAAEALQLPTSIEATEREHLYRNALIRIEEAAR